DEFEDDFDFGDSGTGGSVSGSGIDAFSQQVDQKIKILSTSRKIDDKERIEAAYWLGEFGEPKAITALSLAYRRSKNPKVKAAAEYALGQFKALYLEVRPRKGESFSDALMRE